MAIDSLDHRFPLGTANDNHSNPAFNQKVMEIVRSRPIKILDLGCAGGRMVESFIEMGQVAIGIEGSDYCKKNHRHAWSRIPKNLFTADATKPFTIYNGTDQPEQFDLVTAWEFFEHIKEIDLAEVMQNIKRHLAPGGLFIGSINTYKSAQPKYHQTVKPAAFWIELFEQNGYIYRLDIKNFIQPDWVRACYGSVEIVMQAELRSTR